MHLNETKMKVFVLLVIILARESHSGWNRIWNEEFDDEIFGINKWEIYT